ncbi:MAG: putative DNA-binding protein [Frankiales bacterium]|nr:putative DNA-binding protein [Frankiales bacterium]
MKTVTESQGTRERLLSLLLSLGPSTVTVLSDRLQVSPAGVRRHLDALVADGTVTTREDRRPGLRGRGRPARRYALTEAGHAAGPSAYDDLAAGALAFLAESLGPDAVEAFAARRAAELEDRYADRLDGAPDRTAALAEALAADGYAATVSPHGTGVQLCQHHCPVQHVAAQFPQLCEAETAALGRLLDVHVQRLATIAHGDGVCTTFIPLSLSHGTSRSTDGRPSS